MRFVFSIYFITTLLAFIGCESSDSGVVKSSTPVTIDGDPENSDSYDMNDTTDTNTDSASSSTDTQTEMNSQDDETDSGSENAGQTETGESNSASDSQTKSESQTVDTLPDDADGDGWIAGDDLDCNDSDSTIYPGADEDTDNGIDDNCNGEIDEVESTGDPTCDETGFDIEMSPSRLMILQDLSSSMSSGLGGWGGGDTKWDIARKALQNTLANPSNSAIEFGFDSFPSNDTCGVGDAVTLDAAPNQAKAISDMLSTLSPTGNTPLCLAISNFDPDRHPGYATAFNADGAEKYLLVVSDGSDTCGGTDCSSSSSGYSDGTFLGARTSDLLDAGIKTFVIGYDTGSNASQLKAIAQAGGTGYTTYFDAQDPQALQDALNDVASAVVSCEYKINSSEASADPEKVNFYFDGAAVPYNPGCAGGIGWDWDDPSHESVVFCDDSCTLLKSGGVNSVTAAFGCKSETN